MNSEDLEIDDIGKCGEVMVLPEQFWSFGGFVGLASMIETVIFCLLAFFKLFIAGILFGVTILIIGVGLNRRLYALLRNNIQN